MTRHRAGTEDTERWTAVDEYFADLLVPHDAALTGALARSAAAGLPDHHVSSLQGKFLHLIARICGARRILEVGTLGGYSTIWLARALPPDGHLLTIEVEPARAELASANLEAAGVAGLVDVRAGAGVDVLAAVAAQGAAPFDLVFLDADKGGYVSYWNELVPRVRPGGLLLADNVLWSGRIVDESTDDADTQSLRAFNDSVLHDDRVESIVLPAFDGLTLARRL